MLLGYNLYLFMDQVALLLSSDFERNITYSFIVSVLGSGSLCASIPKIKDLGWALKVYSLSAFSIT
jgi:hypothetical protein